MAINTVNYTFNWAGLQGWVFHTDQPENVTGQLNPIDGGGCLEVVADIPSGGSQSYWEWTGSWGDLGVPAGSTLSQLKVASVSTKVAAYNGGGPTIVNFDNGGGVGIGLYDDSALRATLLGAPHSAPTTAEVSWTVNTSGTNQAIPAIIQASSSAIKLRLYVTIDYCSITVRWDSLTLTATYDGPKVSTASHGTDAYLPSQRMHGTDIWLVPFHPTRTHTLGVNVVNPRQAAHGGDAYARDTHEQSHSSDSCVVAGGYVDFTWDDGSGYADWEPRSFTINEAVYSPGKLNPKTYTADVNNTHGLHAHFNPLKVYSTHGPLPFGWMLCNQLSWADLGVPDNAYVTGVQLLNADSWATITQQVPDQHPTLALFHTQAHQSTALAGCPTDISINLAYPATFGTLYQGRALPNQSGQLSDPYTVELAGEVNMVPADVRHPVNGTGITIQCILYPPLDAGTTPVDLNAQALESRALESQALDAGDLQAQAIGYKFISGSWSYVTTGVNGVITVSSSSMWGSVATGPGGQLGFSLACNVTTHHSKLAVQPNDYPGQVDLAGVLTGFNDQTLGDWVLPNPFATPGTLNSSLDIHFDNSAKLGGVHHGKKWFAFNLGYISTTPDLNAGTTTVHVHWNSVQLSNHPAGPADLVFTVQGVYSPPPPPPPPPKPCVYPPANTQAPGIAIYNTGVNDAGQLLPDGAADPHYLVAASDDPRVTVGAHALVGIRVPAVDAHGVQAPAHDVDSLAGCLSISVRPQLVEDLNGRYDYVTYFNVEGFDPASVKLSGRMCSDDAVVSVVLNGSYAIPGAVQPDLAGAQPISRAVSWNHQAGAGIIDGVNSLRFNTQNLHQIFNMLQVTDLKVTANINWAKLPGLFGTRLTNYGVVPVSGDGTGVVNGFDYGRIFDYARYPWWQAYRAGNKAAFTASFPNWLWDWLLLDYTTRCNPPPPDKQLPNPTIRAHSTDALVKTVPPRCVGLIRIADLYNTGVDDSGNALYDTAADSHYTLISSPVTTAEQPAYACPAFQNANPVYSWVANRTGVSWITRVKDRPMSAASDPVNGEYVYRTKFTIGMGYDPATAQIRGRLAADDEVTILLNGVEVVHATVGYNSLHQFTITGSPSGPFRCGDNTLDFVVRNTGQVVEGLQVDMVGDICPSPDACAVTIPGFAVSLNNISIRIFYELIPPVALAHGLDAAVANIAGLGAVIHRADAFISYAKVHKDLVDQWVDYQLIPKDLDDNWDISAGLYKLLVSNWSVRNQIITPLEDTWNVYWPVRQNLTDNWDVRALIRALLRDNWMVRRRMLKLLRDTWHDYDAVRLDQADDWTVYKLVAQLLTEHYYISPASEFKPRPHWNLQPLEDIITRRCAEPGFNTHRFVELLGGEIVEPTAYEPDPATHRSMYYYNTSTNRLYLKVYDRYEPEKGIIIAHWKGISG